MSLWQYLREEVTRGYILPGDEERYAAKPEKIYTFLKIPRELEKFMSYGFFHCLDSFLFVFTFLPIRFALALVSLLARPLLTCLGLRQRPHLDAPWLYPGEIIDLLKGLLIAICVLVFSYIDTSMMYHLIKSQSVIKLYIIFNMLEVGDRLFSAFGQDTIDSLFWTATEPKNRKRDHAGVIPHFLLTIVYVMAHTLLVLVQATCLNVAINASNKALLTIMISNNFIEIKGSVFKSFNKKNLFQVSCSDVRERFHLFALLFIVVVQTMKEYSWKEESFWSLAPDCLLVLCSEFFVDWIKHAFITRFNEVSSEVYKDYTLHLAYDLAQTKQTDAFADQCDAVSRRMGFMPLPLGVVMIRVVSTSFKTNSRGAPVLILLAYLALLTFRMLGSVVILGKACDLIDQHKSRRNSQKQQSNESQETKLPTAAPILTQPQAQQQPVLLRPLYHRPPPNKPSKFQPEQALLVTNAMAMKTKEQASQELKQASVALEAKIQTMFGAGNNSNGGGGARRDSDATLQQVAEALNGGAGGIMADTAASAETGDRLVSISQTSQQLAPFSTKLNSRPVVAAAAAAPHPSSQPGSSLCEEEADRMIEESSDVVHCEPDTWSQRRTQLLAARQSSTDSRRRPLSCTPPSTSASQSIDLEDEDNDQSVSLNSASNRTNSSRQTSVNPSPATGQAGSAADPIAPGPLSFSSSTSESKKAFQQKDLVKHREGEAGNSSSDLVEEVGASHLEKLMSLDSSTSIQHTNENAGHVVSGSSEAAICQEMKITNKRDSEAEQERTVRQDNEEEAETESSSSDFRPKSMSSPDFLKTYRNNSTDWPALTDESEVEGDDDDDLDGTPAVAAAVEAVKAARDRSDSGSGSSLTRRKRCETVASTEHQ